MYISGELLRREGEPPLMRTRTMTDTISSSIGASQTQDLATQTSTSSFSSSTDLTPTSMSLASTISVPTSSISTPTASPTQISTISSASSSAGTPTLSEAQIFITVVSLLAFIFIVSLLARVIIRRRQHKKEEATLFTEVSKLDRSRHSSVSSAPATQLNLPEQPQFKISDFTSSINDTTREYPTQSIQRPSPAAVAQREVDSPYALVSPMSQTDVNARFLPSSAISDDFYDHMVFSPEEMNSRPHSFEIATFSDGERK